MFSFALEKWGIEEILNRFRKKVDRVLYATRFDLDDYQGDFLLSRIAIEDFKDEGLFDEDQLVKISGMDREILENTVLVSENVYNLTVIKKESYDPKKYWFLYRIPKEAISRLKLYVTEKHESDPENK